MPLLEYNNKNSVKRGRVTIFSCFDIVCCPKEQWLKSHCSGAFNLWAGLIREGEKVFVLETMVQDYGYGEKIW
jgi:hypothetical protein